MAIQGSLEEAALPDVVQLLTLGRKTGRLSLTQGPLRGEIFLDKGAICYAYVASRRDRLGDMLVRTGRITQQQLHDAIEQGRGGTKRVSRILLESGQVERAEMERFFRAQVEEAVYFMFTWRTGEFEFNSNIRPDDPGISVSIDPEGLLLEGARRVDEWSVIEKKIPSFDLVFRLDRTRLKAASVTLTEEQQQILPLIDGSRDVAGVIDLAGMAEFDVGKALYGLITAGFAQVVERRTVVRHLEYRELLAYVVREAEYADPDARRAAARHIADCASCTERLKTIHVRQTGAIPSATLPSHVTGRPAPMAEPVEEHEDFADDSPDYGDGADLRVERRSGAERRVVDRRVGERRMIRTAAWERPGVDRRRGGDRRVTGQRTSQRRLTPAIGGAAPAAAARAGVDRTTRTTGPRRVPAGDPTRGGRPTKRSTERRRSRPGHERKAPRTHPAPPPAPPAPVEVTTDVTPPADAVQPEAAPPAAPEPRPADTAPAEGSATKAAPRPVPASIRPHPRPGPGRAGARTKDIEWLVSPDEADDLLRTSTAGPPPAPASAQRSPAPVVPAPEPVRAAAPMPVRSEVPKSTRVPPRRTRILLPIAAGAIVVAGLGWMALTLSGRFGRSDTLATTTASGAVAAPAAQATQPPAEAQEPPAETPSPPANERAPAATRPSTSTEGPRITRPPVGAAAAVAGPSAPPPKPQAAPAAAAAVAEAPPAPAVATISGVVRDVESNAPLSGARITIPGTSFSATSDDGGNYVLPDVPAGSVTLTVSLGNRPTASRQLTVRAGTPEQVDLLLEGMPAPVDPPPPAAPTPVTATTPDDELASGWTKTDLASAADALGVPLAMIPGLWIESVSTPDGATRPRVRIAQLTPSGERIVLTQTRSGAPVPNDNPRVTALRIIPASQTYPVTTGTASFGNLLVTAKADLSGDSLRTLLAKLVVARPTR